MSIKLLNNKDSFSPIKLKDLEYTLDRVYKVYNLISNDLEIKDYLPLERSVYTKTDEIFLVEMVGFDSLSQLKSDKSITRQRDSDRYIYYANTDGYLALKYNTLTILEPQISDEMKLKSFFIYLPIEVNISYLHSIINNRITTAFSELHEGKKILIHKALDPVEPIDASLQWFFELPEYPPLLESGKIDYKNWNRYLEVKENDLIVEKRLLKEGVAGVDVWGDPILVASAKDLTITAGEHIRIEEKEGHELYIAECAGILSIEGDTVSVIECLVINSDVDYNTGNINFSGDVEIKGDVKAGFTVNCGGLLNISGSVESGVVLRCKRDAYIKRGITGHETRVFVEGNLEVEFIQDSYVRVFGDLTVINSIYHAVVFCGGFCSVMGKRIKRSNHGSVVGGELSSIKGFKLHSVGALASVTAIYCGIDKELIKKVSQLKEVLAVLTTKIIKLQHSLHLESIGGMNKIEKKLLKEKLLELKELNSQKHMLEIKIRDVESRCYSNELSNVEISIDKFILADSKVCIGETCLFIKEKKSQITYRWNNGVISS